MSMSVRTMIVVAICLTMAALSLGPLEPKAQAIIANDCVVQAQEYVSNMVKPSAGDPIAHKKCDILLDKCLELCVCNYIAKHSCESICKGAYEFPLRCP